MAGQTISWSTGCVKVTRNKPVTLRNGVLQIRPQEACPEDAPRWQKRAAALQRIRQGMPVGIVCEDSCPGLTLENVTIRGFFHGVEVRGRVAMRDCVCERGGAGVMVQGPSAHATLTRCRVARNERDAVTCRAGATACVDDCDIRDNHGAGVLCWGADSDVTCRGTRIAGHALAGACASLEGHMRLEGCVLVGNGSSGVYCSDAGSLVHVLASCTFGWHPGPCMHAYGGGVVWVRGSEGGSLRSLTQALEELEGLDGPREGECRPVGRSGGNSHHWIASTAGPKCAAELGGVVRWDRDLELV
ncbi:unnamed protein product [Pedinophyceae sp. YPF-701]|nr:unnamed protein product [Pedinophyceae sp. YPF-701]